MIILGIDPGLATVGFGVINAERGHYTVLDYGIISTPKEDTLPVRLRKVEEGVKTLIETYHPQQVAVEELFFSKNVTTGIAVAEARGVILLCAEQKNIPISEYTPLQVKQSVVGYGRADKKQVITMVTLLLSLAKPPRPDDTADALAIAICHAHCGGSRIAKYFNGQI
jgi:crossover junction endodeoxyribonuclease RuvC